LGCRSEMSDSFPRGDSPRAWLWCICQMAHTRIEERTSFAARMKTRGLKISLAASTDAPKKRSDHSKLIRILSMFSSYENCHSLCHTVSTDGRCFWICTYIRQRPTNVHTPHTYMCTYASDLCTYVSTNIRLRRKFM
jgi:hypothetical protein